MGFNDPCFRKMVTQPNGIFVPSQDHEVVSMDRAQNVPLWDGSTNKATTGLLETQLHHHIANCHFPVKGSIPCSAQTCNNYGPKAKR